MYLYPHLCTPNMMHNKCVACHTDNNVANVLVSARHANTCMCTHKIVNIHAFTFTHMHTHANTQIRTHTHVYARVHVHTYRRVYTDMHTHRHGHTCAHARIHIHINTHMQEKERPGICVVSVG